MKYDTLMIVVVPLLLLTGCNHTVQGVQQDAQENAPLVKAAAQQATQGIEQAGQKTDKVVSTDLNKLDKGAHMAVLATRIKAQIIENKDLTASGNSISVHSSPSGVTLTGHVATSSQKSAAMGIAKKVIAADSEPAPLSDQLVVQPG